MIQPRHFLMSVALVLSLFSHQAWSLAALPQQSLEDQHGQTLQIDEQTQLVIFTRSQAAGEVVRDTIIAKKLYPLAQRQWVYVADISAMPSLIAKWFAIPKMQDYPFQMALDKSGEVTKDWPYTPDAISLIFLKQNQVTEVKTVKTAEELLAALGA